MILFLDYNKISLNIYIYKGGDIRILDLKTTYKANSKVGSLGIFPYFLTQIPFNINFFNIF